MPRAHIVLGIEFERLRFGNRQARFWGWLQASDALPGVATKIVDHRSNSKRLGRGRLEWTDTETYSPTLVPGVGALTIEGTRFVLPLGFAMRWVSLAP